MRMLNIDCIEEKELASIVNSEQCRANWEDHKRAKSPCYRKYTVQADEFMNVGAYSLWRTNKDRTECIPYIETPPTEAFPITFAEFALLPKLFDSIKFDQGKDYFATSNAIVFHCSSCGVHVVMDGNHRLLQCAIQKRSPEITVYEVVSDDWRESQVDMKNFCKCITASSIG